MKDHAKHDPTSAEPNAGDGALVESSLGKIDASVVPFENLDEVQEGFSMLDLEDRVVISLLFNELIGTDHVEAAWYRARDQQKIAERGEPVKLWRALAEDATLDRAVIYKEAAKVFAFKETKVTKFSALACLRQARDLFPAPQWDRMRDLHLIPIAMADTGDGTARKGAKKGKGHRETQAPARRWVFVSHDPTNREIQQFLKTLALPYYDLQFAPEAFIDELISETTKMVRNEYLERVQETEGAFDLGVDIEHDGDDLLEEEELEAEINRSALINLFEAALFEAVRLGASDIHICPDEHGNISINFRIDGELTCWYVEEKAPPEAFLAVAKDRTRNVDRFERERGQDGYLQRTIDGLLIRFRVSILPITHSNQQARYESIVIRVLDDRKVIADLSVLGLPERELRLFEEAIRQPQGMVILTGPTGSGKSTTLYAALHQVRSATRNILTAEDPVEYVLPGVRQVKISHKLPVKEALRFILRHDPDIVMVGEMRDRDTAELGIQLANTGHLTFSTLHTNDAPSAVSRLYKMGLEPFLIAHSVTIVAAQRLIRTLCPSCKEVEEAPDRDTLERVGFTAEEIEAATLYRVGANPNCKTCKGNGYKGRRAIVEVMPMSKDLRRMIVTAEGNLDEDALRDQAVLEGMTPLTGAARALAAAGETSVEEMVRVVGVLR
ncbi:MAG: GspE/PulE family protein [Rhodothermales bacterium]